MCTNVCSDLCSVSLVYFIDFCFQGVCKLPYKGNCVYRRKHVQDEIRNYL
jgi:hypothetical protein